MKKLCFNPSVGILGGHTRRGREPPDRGTTVSIPQSGFLVVTPWEQNGVQR